MLRLFIFNLLYFCATIFWLNKIVYNDGRDDSRRRAVNWYQPTSTLLNIFLIIFFIFYMRTRQNFAVG